MADLISLESAAIDGRKPRADVLLAYNFFAKVFALTNWNVILTSSPSLLMVRGLTRVLVQRELKTPRPMKSNCCTLLKQRGNIRLQKTKRNGNATWA